MSGRSSSRLSQRRPSDLLVRGREQFRRGELDRSIGEANTAFSLLCRDLRDPKGLLAMRDGGYKHTENMPVVVAAKIARATGHVALTDIGCGTGNTLFTWGRWIADEAKCKLGRVSMTGVSLQDYAGESMNPEAIWAVSGSQPLMRYIVGDAEQLSGIETDSQDVVLAWQSLLYARHPERWLREMVRIGRPGGTVFFNSKVGQRGEDEIAGYLDELYEDDYGVLRNRIDIPVIFPAGPFGPARRGYERMMLHRVDVPPVTAARFVLDLAA